MPFKAPHPNLLRGAVSQPILAAQVVPRVAMAGSDLTLSTQGEPHAQMSIDIQDLDLTQFMSLLPQEADDSGRASWRFHVSDGYRADSLPLIITQDAGSSKRKLVLNVPVLHREQPRVRVPLRFVAFPKFARPGQRVAVTIQTLPGAKTRIEAQGAGFPQASSLMDRTADKQGLVTWTWQLRTNYEANVMPVVATVDYKDHEQKIVGQIVVLH